MKYLALLAAVLGLCVVPITASASDDAQETVQDFYDGYMKVISGDDSDQWVLASPDVTKAFKKVFKAYMNDSPEANPIICGQDYPDAGYKVTDVEEDGTDAVATMKSRDPSFKNTFKVKLVKSPAGWQIADINDFLNR